MTNSDLGLTAARFFWPLRSLMIGAAIVLGGCSIDMKSTPPPEVARAQDLGQFPYSPLVYHLDLSILAYQIYAQTLVWPFDPFYEEHSEKRGKRNAVMDRVHDWAQSIGAKQAGQPPSHGGYRGPGVLGGFPNNPRNDPIITRYDQIRPWQPAIFNASGRWTEYTPPAEITDKIAAAHICYRRTGGAVDDVVISEIATNPNAGRSDRRDVLLAFEGATGDKGESGQPASQSMMGFILFRHLPSSNRYDVHIVFRGSRSGDAVRAALKANFTRAASGNPDWVTDLGWTRIGEDDGVSAITTVGTVHRGFARSMKQTLPRLFACLDHGASITRGSPRNIYVTGHSLGGGLAQHFASAVLLGNSYGPAGKGPLMPDALASWPWTKIKLISFGAPRAGDQIWARKLTRDGLQSDVFDTALMPIDLNALAVHDPSIRPRLLDETRPAGYRLLISTDPISTQKFNNGKHVGKSVYVNRIGPASALAIAKLKSHEPEVIRQMTVAALADPIIPAPVVRYREIADLTPDADLGNRGSPDELAKLRQSFERYFDRGRWHLDRAQLRKDFDYLIRDILTEDLLAEN